MIPWQQELDQRLATLYARHKHELDSESWRDDPWVTDRLTSRLRAHYALEPQVLSTDEASRKFCGVDESSTEKERKNAQRCIKRSHRQLRRSYGDRFIEVPRFDGGQLLAPVRYLAPHPARLVKPPGSGRWASLLKRTSVVDVRDLDLRDQVEADRVVRPLDVDPGDLELQASSDRACARPRGGASRVKRDRKKTERKQATRAGVERRKATRYFPPREPLWQTPVALEEALRAALASRLGEDDFEAIQLELRRQKYHLRIDEALLAARTLLERTPRKGWLAMFRWAFNEACDGNQLVDAKDENKRLNACELAALKAQPELCEDWSQFKELARDRYGLEHVDPVEERWEVKVDPPRPPGMSDEEFRAALKRRDRFELQAKARNAVWEEFYLALDALNDALSAEERAVQLAALRLRRDEALDSLGGRGPPA